MATTDRRTFIKGCGMAAAGAVLAFGKNAPSGQFTMPVRKLG